MTETNFFFIQVNIKHIIKDNYFFKFRLSKEMVRDVIIPFITLNHSNNRGLPIPSILRLLITLRFYASSNFQVSFTYVHIIIGVC